MSTLILQYLHVQALSVYRRGHNFLLPFGLGYPALETTRLFDQRLYVRGSDGLRRARRC